MKLINRFFIFLMAASLSAAILSFSLDRTILNADYVTAQADKSGIYTELAKQLPKQLAGDTETSPAFQSALERIVTPEYLQAHLDQYIHDLESAYRSGAAIPPLDLTDIMTQAQALGVRLTPAEQAQLQKQLVIEPTGPASTEASKPSGLAQIYRRINQGKFPLIILTLLLAALVFATAPHHRLKALAHGLFTATAWLGVYWLILKAVPNLVIHQLNVSAASPLTTAVNTLIASSTAGVDKLILYCMAATAGSGVVLLVASLFTPHLAVGNHGGDSRTPLPSMFHKD